MDAAPSSLPRPASDAHPARDAVIVTLFAALLAVGGIGAWVKRELAVTAFENRNTAPWPARDDLRAGTRAWTSKFELAFADRFGGRDRGIEAHHRLSVLVFRTSPVPNILIGREGWLYFLGENGASLERDVLGTLPYPPEEPAAIAREVKRRHDWFAARGIRYVFVIAPDKATIHPEHLPAWATPAAGPTRLDRVYEALRAYPEVVALDVRPALRAAKTTRQVYLKTDSHWSYGGAMIAYDAIMRAAQAMLPAIPHVPAKWPSHVPGRDLEAGDLAQMLGIPRRLREEVEAPLGKVLADASRCARRIARSAEQDVHECARDALPKAVVYHDSMAIPMVPTLSENFRRTVYVQGHLIDPALIERERPDLVIEEIVQRAMGALPATPVGDR